MKPQSKKKQKPKYNMWQNTAYYIALAWRVKEKKVIFLGMLLAFFVVLNNLVNLYVSPAILSAVEMKASFSELLLTILVFVGAMMICSAALAYINSNVPFGRISVRMSVMDFLIEKAATTSYPNVNEDSFIKLMSKSDTATSSNDQSTEAIWTTLTILLHDGICFVIWFLLLSSISPMMITVILITSVIGYFVSKYANGYEYRRRDELSEYENRMWYINNRARDYGAAKDIRIFGIKEWLDELGDKALGTYLAFRKKAENIYSVARVTDTVLSFLRNAIAYIYLINLVIRGEISASEFLLYFSAVSGFTVWVCGILRSLSELHRHSLEISTVRECLEYPEKFKFDEGERLTPENVAESKDKKYEIRLENVSFRYPGADEDILSDINLTLHPGENLAIVGINGAGKTTLVRIICGLYDPTEGHVLLNGRDIREYNRRDYYAMFSAVFQNFNIIAGSIAVNVAQSTNDIDMDRVAKCVREAGLEKKIKSLAKGYDTPLERWVYEDAVELSGGEMQRLMLARALYKDAPFVILDEPTAALDPIAESDIYMKYGSMTRQKSSVYISHRLASTRFCDRIILIEGNVIAEEGTHEELLNKNGRYAELFEIQSRYYREGGLENEE